MYGLDDRAGLWSKVLRAGLMIACALVLVVLVCAVIYYPRFAQTGLYRNVYEGTVVDKSQTFRETKRGSGIVRQLIIREDNGNTFAVVVERDLYERGLVGMWIKKNGEHVELSWPGPKASATVVGGVK